MKTIEELFDVVAKVNLPTFNLNHYYDYQGDDLIGSFDYITFNKKLGTSTVYEINDTIKTFIENNIEAISKTSDGKTYSTDDLRIIIRKNKIEKLL